MRRRKSVSARKSEPRELQPRTQEQIAAGFFSWGDDGLLDHEAAHAPQASSGGSGGGWFDPWGDGFWS